MTDRQGSRRETRGYASTSIAVRIGLFVASLACAVVSGFAVTLIVNESPPTEATRPSPSPAGLRRLMDSMRPAIQAHPSPAALPQAESVAPVPTPAVEPPAPPAARMEAAPPEPTPAPKALAPAAPGLRPSAEPATRTAAPSPTVSAAPRPASAASASPGLPTGGPFVAQVGAFPTVAMAQESWAALAMAHPALAGLSPQLKPVTLSGRIVYRSQVAGFASKAAAMGFCRTLKASGDDCFVPAESDSTAPAEPNR